MGWERYLESFHRQRPGITEAVLRRSTAPGRDGEEDPYKWLAAAVPAQGWVLDLACGSAPLWPALAGHQYVGLDTSAGELAAARKAGAGPLIRASASAIPLADHSVDVVACSMGLMVLTPLPAVLAEIARVLAPGGMLAATVPARGPLRGRDLPVVAGLLALLGRGLGYPGDRELRRLGSHLARAGLRPEADERRRFGYRLRSQADAGQFLSSLYLPGLPTGRYQRARACLRMLARFHAELPVPIRRITATAGGPGPA